MMRTVFMFFATTFVALQASGAPTDAAPEHYVVFLDLGSSGTKVKIYSWTQSGSELPVIALSESKKFKPGVSTLGDDLSQLPAYLDPIIRHAEKYVPQEEWDETPIFAMATAGLRFLEANTSRDIMLGIRLYLEGTSSPFLYKKSDVQVLSGEEEAVYAWVALNYLLGYFDSPRAIHESRGLLEMGGGSTQIAFIPQEPLYAGEFQVVLSGQLYEIYAHSYLDYGLDAIRLRLAKYLKSKSLMSWFPWLTIDVKNPCLLGGDKKEYIIDGKKVTTVGTANGRECYRTFQKMLAPSDDCEPKPCAVGNQYQPSVGGIQFYATSAFKYAPSSLEVVGEDDILVLDDLKKAGFKYCRQSLDEAIAKGLHKDYASATCLQSEYFPVLIAEAYKIPDVKLTSNVGSESIDWALGAVVMELSRHLEIEASVKRRR